MEGKKIKVKHLVFLLAVAAFISAFSFMPRLELPSGTTITNNEMWALGFSPLFLILGLMLAIAAIAAWRGSSQAFTVCRWWAALYSLMIGGTVIWHFPNKAVTAIFLGILWAGVWYFSIRKWYNYQGSYKKRRPLS